jgi:hypothetical protein
MIKRFLLAIAGVCLLVATGCTNTLTPEHQSVLAKTCTTGQTFYGYIKAAATTEAVPANVERIADNAYSVLKPLCDKGSSATQTDIVLAGAQVYVLTKAWRDAT